MKRAPIRVLLVEDNPLHAHLLQAFLGQIVEQSFPVRRARSLNEAFKMVREESFDVVLLDLVLPESRGLGTFFRWRAQAPSVPVVVLTGLEDLELATQAVESGAEDYLLKNQINAALLSRSLRYAVDRSRVRRREWDSPLYRAATQRLLKAAETEELEGLIRQRLLYPVRAQLFSRPLLRTGDVIFSYWVEHLAGDGPRVGGLRVAPSVSLGEMAALSLFKSLQGALFELPFRGAMGGICGSAQELEREELRGVVEGFVAEIGAVIERERTVLVPDDGVDQEVRGWMQEALWSDREGASLGSVPVGVLEVGVARWGEFSGGFLVGGAALLAQEMGLSLSGARIAIQAGVQSLELAEIFAGVGAKVVAVGSAMGALVDEEGLDLGEMRRYLEEHGNLRQCPVGRPLEGARMLEVECELFVAALSDQQIRAEQAQRARCKILVEGVSGALSMAADEVFRERAIFVLPALFVSGGAEIGSFLQWSAARRGHKVGRRELKEQVLASQKSAFERVWRRADSSEVDLRTAALKEALEELQEELLEVSVGGGAP